MSSLQEKHSGKQQISALGTAKTAIKAANAYNANKAATAFTAGTPVATSASGGTVLANQTTIPMTGYLQSSGLYSDTTYFCYS